MLIAKVPVLIFISSLAMIVQGIQDDQNPKTLYPVTIRGASRVALPDMPSRRGVEVYIFEDPQYKGHWVGDHFILQVLSLDWSPKVLAQRKFSSSYGNFHLSLVDLTGDGVEEFVFVRGQGRGTNVRAEDLVVWQREGRRFISLLDIRVSHYFGAGHWQYERVFTDVDGNGTIDLRLVLKLTPTHPGLDIPSLIPTLAIQEYVFDNQTGKMKLYQSVKRGGELRFGQPKH